MGSCGGKNRELELVNYHMERSDNAIFKDIENKNCNGREVLTESLKCNRTRTYQITANLKNITAAKVYKETNR